MSAKALGSHFSRAKALRKVVILRDNRRSPLNSGSAAFFSLQRLCGVFLSAKIDKGLHIIKIFAFTFFRQAARMRQIECAYRKCDFRTRRNHLKYKILMRKSKNRTFCFFTLFANALAYGKGECAALYGMRALIYAAQRGKPFGFPLKSRKIAGVSSPRFS